MTKSKEITLQVFYDMLECHDWYYMYSDDYKIWTNGKNDQELINRITQKSEEFLTLYTEYRNWKMDVNRKYPKPERPKQ